MAPALFGAGVGSRIGDHDLLLVGLDGECQGDPLHRAGGDAHSVAPGGVEARRLGLEVIEPGLEAGDGETACGIGQHYDRRGPGGRDGDRGLGNDRAGRIGDSAGDPAPGSQD